MIIQMISVGANTRTHPEPHCIVLPFHSTTNKMEMHYEAKRLKHSSANKNRAIDKGNCVVYACGSRKRGSKFS